MFQMAGEVKLERSQSLLLRAAEEFCDADNEVQEARRWWRELKDYHDPYDGICLFRNMQRSHYCIHCRNFLDNAPDYNFALFRRRAAKTRMKRAFKKLLEVRVSISNIIKMIEKDGWCLVKTIENSRRYKHSSKSGLITISGNPNQELSKATLNSILKQTGLKQ